MGDDQARRIIQPNDTVVDLRTERRCLGRVLRGNATGDLIVEWQCEDYPRRSVLLAADEGTHWKREETS